MDAGQTENKTNLYDYFYIQFGIRPRDEQIELFKTILINSPRGKECKKMIDAAMELMATFTTQKYDVAVISIVNAYLADLILEKSKK